MSKKVAEVTATISTEDDPTDPAPAKAEEETGEPEIIGLRSAAEEDRGKPGFIDYITTAYDKTAYTKLGTGYDRRPNADAILAVVLHLKTAKDSFIPEADKIARGRKDSTHYLVSLPEDGHINIAEIVPPYLMAHHAGPSMRHGYYDWDTISVGITVLVGAEQTELDPLQWTALEWLIGMLRRHYPSITYIERHSSIAQSEKPIEDPALGPPAEFKKWQAAQLK